MTTLPRISLAKNWRYRYAPVQEKFSGTDVSDSDWAVANWADIIIKDAGAKKIWARNRFHLEPTMECVRYFLRTDRFVFPAQVFLRGKLIAEVSLNESLDLDVTDEVSLSNNILMLAIDPSGWKQEKPADLYLQAIFCDDLP